MNFVAKTHTKSDIWDGIRVKDHMGHNSFMTQELTIFSLFSGVDRRLITFIVVLLEFLVLQLMLFGYIVWLKIKIVILFNSYVSLESSHKVMTVTGCYFLLPDF